MKSLPLTKTNHSLMYDWDNKLRSGTMGSDSINLKYDPSGNRIYKKSGSTERKYIVDIVGDLPVILMELDTSGNIKKTYIYANGQILMQHDGDHTANRYFYLHNRLGSIRELVKLNGSNVDVVKMHTYEPFGKTLENEADVGAPDNPFMFTGQFYDSEINEYYLRARQYDPHISRFTSRDPVAGKFEEPLSLHKYLYCQNDPVNRLDPIGLAFMSPYGYSYEGRFHGESQTQQIIQDATQFVGRFKGTPLWWLGPAQAFQRPGWYDVKEAAPKDIFNIGGREILYASEFGNYLAGYTTWFNWRERGFKYSLAAGIYFADEEWWDYRLGRNDRYVRWYFDDFGSMYWQFRGAQQANREAYTGLRSQLDNIVLGAAVWNLNTLRQLDYFQYNK